MTIVKVLFFILFHPMTLISNIVNISIKSDVFCFSGSEYIEKCSLSLELNLIEN